MLLDELKELMNKASQKGCAVNSWVASQDKEFQEVFEAIKNNPNSNITQTLLLIKKHHPDVPFKRTSFNYHMRGTCSCQTV